MRVGNMCKSSAYLFGQARVGELFQLVQINVHKLAVMFIERLNECKQTRKWKLICVSACVCVCQWISIDKHGLHNKKHKLKAKR